MILVCGFTFKTFKIITFSLISARRGRCWVWDFFHRYHKTQKMWGKTLKPSHKCTVTCLRLLLTWSKCVNLHENGRLRLEEAVCAGVPGGSVWTRTVCGMDLWKLEEMSHTLPMCFQCFLNHSGPGSSFVYFNSSAVEPDFLFVARCSGI